MKIINLLKIAWRAIILNKVRSLLTMLGIIIGVSSVIAMLAIGEGSKKSIRTQISSMGSNMITVRPGADTRGGIQMDASDTKTLTLGDYEALKTGTKMLSFVSPMVNENGQSIYGSNNWPTTIFGVNDSYLKIKVWNLKSGALFSDHDIKVVRKVAIIGQTVVNNLFPNEDPLGKTIRFNSIPFKVIGVLTKKGENTFGQDQDDVILSPYTTVQKRILAQNHLSSIIASSVSEEKSQLAVNEIMGILKKRHKITKNKADDFNVFSMEELISTFSTTSEMLTVLLVVIAGISLLVGGIGIMNIMYVSVKERTREIGLRLALGGKESDILMQFLIESIMISVTGGIIGVSLGLGTTVFVEKVLHWPTEVTLFSIEISFLVCVITGIFFGWYPAKKAATLDPITALRYE